MSMLKKALIAMALILFADQAYADGITGNEFYEKCRKLRSSTNLDYLDAGFCLGYAGGVWDGSFFFATILPAYNDAPSCVPPFLKKGERITDEKILDSIINYLRANPTKRSKNISDLSWTALAEAFPCPK